ncbi:MAG: 50S ribosomal protein L13 [Candidatus Uhrbacteria bacterium]
MVNTNQKIQRAKHEIDANGMTLGRIATKAATFLRGKHKATFAPHIDAGDFVQIVNLSGVRFTGRKLETKLYQHHTGWPGGLRSEQLKTRWERNPELVLRDAVYGMLPKNKLRESMIKRLSVKRHSA